MNYMSDSSTNVGSCLKSMINDTGIYEPIDYGKYFFMFLYIFYLFVS